MSATYSDGEESDYSDSVEVTPQAQTVHQEAYDDGTAEEFQIALTRLLETYDSNFLKE